MQVQTSSSSSAAKRRSPVIEDTAQDSVLRTVVRLLEQEQRAHGWSWSWLANESELTPSAYYAWRVGKTKGFFLKRINAALKPLGYRLKVERIK